MRYNYVAHQVRSRVGYEKIKKPSKINLGGLFYNSVRVLTKSKLIIK